MNIRHLLYILIASICSVACTEIDDTVTEATTATVSLSLKATRANTGAYTSDAEECELIKWYRVVITDNNRKILVCIDKTLSSALEMDPMDEIILNPGSYNVYAFANIDYDYLNSIDIKENGIVPQNINIIKYAVPSHFNATPDVNDKLQGDLVSVTAFADAGEYVPMTSLAPQSIEVTSRVNQTFNIEVRRMFAKLEFVFSNNTDEVLQVNSISVSNMTVNKSSTEGSILLRNYEEIRDHITIENNIATLTHTFGTPSIISTSGETVSHSFYVLESSANTVTKSFDLTFNVTREGQAATGALEDYMRYALTDPSTITLIHRNDWIVIPITFGEWQMRLEARSYPPIGGYPEAGVQETSDNNFIVTFQGGGDFSIRPFIRKYFDGSDWFGIDDNTKVEGAPIITVDDPTHLFTTTPNGSPILTTTGEIRGKMNSNVSGLSACITISVNVITKTSPKETKTLTRKIYVTQK